jgi:hypothetical protein
VEVACTFAPRLREAILWDKVFGSRVHIQYMAKSPNTDLTIELLPSVNTQQS